MIYCFHGLFTVTARVSCYINVTFQKLVQQNRIHFVHLFEFDCGDVVIIITIHRSKEVTFDNTSQKKRSETPKGFEEAIHGNFFFVVLHNT